jgi:hypothetical protein
MIGDPSLKDLEPRRNRRAFRHLCAMPPPVERDSIGGVDTHPHETEHAATVVPG